MYPADSAPLYEDLIILDNYHSVYMVDERKEYSFTQLHKTHSTTCIYYAFEM